MRREKSRDTLQSAALARVRMFLKADLGWLPGFPLGIRDRRVEWVVVPREDGHAPERLILGRQNLQRAIYTYNRLVFRFPRALPRAVEDIAAWKRGVPLLVDMLKPGVHAHGPLPPAVIGIPGVFAPSVTDACGDLLNRHPALERFINALGYVLLLTPDELPAALLWAGRHAAEIQNYRSLFSEDEGLVTLVSLWELTRRTRYRDTDLLLRILGDRRSATVPTHGWAPHLSGLRQAIVDSTKLLGRIKPPEVPRPVLTDALKGFVITALGQPFDARKRTLELFNIVLDLDFLGPWEAAWRRLDQTPAARQHLPRNLNPAALELEVQRYETRIKGFLRDQPPEIHISALLKSVLTSSSPDAADGFGAICRALRALPPIHDGAPARAAILHNLADPDKIKNRLFAATIRRFATHLASGPGPGALLRPWSNVLKAWTEGQSQPGFPWSILDTILDVGKEPSTIEICFRALERTIAVRPEGVEYDWARSLMVLAAELKDAGIAVTYAERMAAAGASCSHYDGDIIQAARGLDRAGADFGRLFKILSELDAESSASEEMESILRLDRDLRDKGWEGLVAGAVLSGEGPSVLAMSARRRALRALGGTCDPPSRVPAKQVPEWIGQYPPEFAGELSALALLGPEAEQTARRLFGQDFVPPSAIRGEIAVLERKIRDQPDNPGQAQRLAGLRSRLASSGALSPAKSLRIRTRLDRGVRKMVFKLWDRRLDEAFRSSLLDALGVKSIPREMESPDFWPVLASIMTLSKRFRETALELLRRRAGPPPWNLVDHPANTAFLERMSKQGIDTGPWTDKGSVRTVCAQNGRTLALSLAGDPLDIFRMGAYFQTCLSPGGINFYSTVSNAADINKRVLLAKDKSGSVAARCLFALNEQGGILTFHPYCHDKSLDFPDIVARFAADLASRMNTAVVTKGRVECLVVPRWYDDGPRDTGFRFPCLEEGSAFRSQIETIKPEDLLAAAAAAVAPLPLNALTLPPIVMLPEIEDRPELVLPLLTCLEQSEDVPVEVWARAADLARQAGRLEQARRVFDKRLVPYLAKQIRNDYLDKEIIELGLAIDPSAVLRVFRQNRPRGWGIRSDEREPSYRREFIAKAHERLGRGHLASRLRPTD